MKYNYHWRPKRKFGKLKKKMFWKRNFRQKKRSVPRWNEQKLGKAKLGKTFGSTSTNLNGFVDAGRNGRLGLDGLFAQRRDARPRRRRQRRGRRRRRQRKGAAEVGRGVRAPVLVASRRRRRRRDAADLRVVVRRRGADPEHRKLGKTRYN